MIVVPFPSGLGEVVSLWTDAPACERSERAARKLVTASAADVDDAEGESNDSPLVFKLHLVRGGTYRYWLEVGVTDPPLERGAMGVICVDPRVLVGKGPSVLPIDSLVSLTMIVGM